jgi:hypothetical protein|nr:MAG TPA: hypothetical protein [Caudoviricetes sp.]
MTAQVNLVLNGIVYCLKGAAVAIDKRKGKYSIVKRVEQDGEKEKEILFKVSNDLLESYFAETMSYPQDINS